MRDKCTEVDEADLDVMLDKNDRGNDGKSWKAFHDAGFKEDCCWFAH